MSRSIDLHKISTKDTNEEAIAGKMSGLIELNESVTWRAKHFGVYQKLSSRITEFDRPNYFVDEMIEGAFSSFRHQHVFKSLDDNMTEVIDVFDYKSPFWFLGTIADNFFLKRYMTNLLRDRNDVIKDFAENNKWQSVLPDNYFPLTND
ncbi:SRPBCC family protein [Roseivirga sp. E12]|uniref:SRPBCC family protein n=1 Tax=Roseivirga sp. E12 TaxID=2819237 RepID=UPI001F39E35E|nr:SRPBCC family protein [Roseivirga sp. E12]